MRKNQLLIDKAVALFFGVQNQFGRGALYRSTVVPEFGHKFDFTKVRINHRDFSVGILHEPMLVTILFCNKINAFKNKVDNGSIVYIFYAGKLGPVSTRADWYQNKIKIVQCGAERKGIPFLNTYKIIKKFSKIDLKHPIPPNLSKMSVVEVILDKEGRVSEIKKGL